MFQSISLLLFLSSALPFFDILQQLFFRILPRYSFGVFNFFLVRSATRDIQFLVFLKKPLSHYCNSTFLPLSLPLLYRCFLQLFPCISFFFNHLQFSQLFPFYR